MVEASKYSPIFIVVFTLFESPEQALGRTRSSCGCSQSSSATMRVIKHYRFIRRRRERGGLGERHSAVLRGHIRCGQGRSRIVVWCNDCLAVPGRKKPVITV